MKQFPSFFKSGIFATQLLTTHRHTSSLQNYLLICLLCFCSLMVHAQPGRVQITSPDDSDFLEVGQETGFTAEFTVSGLEAIRLKIISLASYFCNPTLPKMKYP
ncbi:MAG: hypothetical protein KA103_02225 [Saprospiraceae bacterium]|nr:hypothetical protein [Saprospiraceae bacterium]